MKEVRHIPIIVARQLFVTKGLKKTSLEELTSSVGIVKSSFYTFFESKESLYLELLELEARGMEERMVSRKVKPEFVAKKWKRMLCL